MWEILPQFIHELWRHSKDNVFLTTIIRFLPKRGPNSVHNILLVCLGRTQNLTLILKDSHCNRNLLLTPSFALYLPWKCICHATAQYCGWLLYICLRANMRETFSKAIFFGQTLMFYHSHQHSEYWVYLSCIYTYSNCVLVFFTSQQGLSYKFLKIQIVMVLTYNLWRELHTLAIHQTDSILDCVTLLLGILALYFNHSLSRFEMGQQTHYWNQINFQSN